MHIIFRSLHLFFAFVFVASIFISSCKKKEDEELPAPFINKIIADKSKDKVLPLDTVYFSVVTNIPSTIEWDFDDGTSNATGENVMHVFSQIKYYRVSVRATANNRTAIGTTDINTTAFSKFRLLYITVKAIPVTNPLGGVWDTDGLMLPDIFAFPDIAGFTNFTTPTIDDVPTGSNLNYQLSFGGPQFFDDMGSDFKISLEDDDDLGESESIALFTLSGGLKELLNTNPANPPTTKILTQGGATIEMKVLWIP